MGSRKAKADWIDTLESIASTPTYPEGWLSTLELASMYDVSPRTMRDRLYKAEREGLIKSVKIGNTRYWPGPDADFKA